jgi:chromosome segregation ATPase
MVTPGIYKVTAAKRVDDVVTPIGETQTFEVVSIGTPSLPVPDRKDTLAFQMSAGELRDAASGAAGRMQETLDQLTEIKNVLARTRKGDLKLLDEARAIELKLFDLRDSLAGDSTRTNRSQTARFSINQRIRAAASGSLSSSYGPTKTHRRQYELAHEELGTLIKELKKLTESDFEKLKQKLDDAGVPWTAGRQIPKLKPRQ